MERSSGILLPLFSIPSDYGIGTLGEEAYKFIDFLARAKQTYWQMLPLGPTSYGDSPYQSFSSYAGNPYFIDLAMLKNAGLLSAKDLSSAKVDDNRYVDYGKLYNTRYQLLQKAYKKDIRKHRDEFNSFCKENKWLKDYSLFMALKKHFEMLPWQKWPDSAIRKHEKEAVKAYSKLLKKEIEFQSYMQFMFFRQYSLLKHYAELKNIQIIGDVPIYVALDSADTWANPEVFQLDEENYPTEVAGVPPDYFSEDGQLWGNALYNWDKMKANGYKWWINRINGASKFFDVVRIDHFRGFESYWAVPYGETTARNGRWIKGPSTDFINKLKKGCPKVEFIAEDLGTLTPEVDVMLEKSGFPGMRVVEFGMDGSFGRNTPFNFPENTIAYVGTHDNSTAMGWKNDEKVANDVINATRYFNVKKKDLFSHEMIRGTMACPAKLFVAQMQDWLALDDSARINTPGTSENNWKWRMLKKEATDQLADLIAEMSETYGRVK